MKRNNGSALLYIFIITSVATTITMSWWHKSSMNYDVILKREQFYKNFSLTDSVMSYGISIAKSFFDDILSARLKMPVNMNMKFFLEQILKSKNNFDAEFVFEKVENKSIKLSSVLYENNKQVCSIKCFLNCKQVYESKPEFSISYYTVSNFS